MVKHFIKLKSGYFKSNYNIMNKLALLVRAHVADNLKKNANFLNGFYKLLALAYNFNAFLSTDSPGGTWIYSKYKFRNGILSVFD